MTITDCAVVSALGAAAADRLTDPVSATPVAAATANAPTDRKERRMCSSHLSLMTGGRDYYQKDQPRLHHFGWK
jgi:hypothetical protein